MIAEATLIEKRWTVKRQSNAAQAEALGKELNINPILANLLLQRGVTNYEEARTFFRPSISDLHDPFLMQDMDKAIARIALAISRNSNILVYGDYDVDGTTDVACVYSFLKS